MRKEEEAERNEVQFEGALAYAFQTLLSEDDYILSYLMAQELYNRICSVLFLVSGVICEKNSKK